MADVQEASRSEKEKFLAESRRERGQMVLKMGDANQKLVEASRAENQKLQEAILSKIEKELEATSVKLQQIHQSVSKSR